jgi:hypothetical protein
MNLPSLLPASSLATSFSIPSPPHTHTTHTHHTHTLPSFPSSPDTHCSTLAGIPYISSALPGGPGYQCPEGEVRRQRKRHTYRREREREGDRESSEMSSSYNHDIQ